MCIRRADVWTLPKLCLFGRGRTFVWPTLPSVRKRRAITRVAPIRSRKATPEGKLIPSFERPRAVVATKHNRSSIRTSADATARVPPDLMEHPRGPANLIERSPCESRGDTCAAPTVPGTCRERTGRPPGSPLPGMGTRMINRKPPLAYVGDSCGFRTGGSRLYDA